MAQSNTIRGGATVSYDTLANLQRDASFADGTIGEVFNDGTNNGLYSCTSGAWTKTHNINLLNLAAPVSRSIVLTILHGRNGDYTVFDATGSATAFKVAGTVGTAIYLTTAAVQNTTNTCVALFETTLPSWFVSGTDMTLTASVKRVVASGTTLTTSIDCEAWVIAADGTAGTDICATNVQAFTGTSATNKTFTLTGTTLAPFSRLLIRITGVATEGGNAGTVATQINSLTLS